MMHYPTGLEECKKIYPGFVHLDIKPENCMRTPYHLTKLSDFGLATRNAFGSLRKLELTKPKSVRESICIATRGGDRCVGTPAYMSPEQITGISQITSAADVYSLSVMALELLTNVNPFERATNWEQLLTKHIKGLSPAERDWPDWMKPSARRVLDAGLSLNPANRPQPTEIRHVMWESYDGPVGNLVTSDRIHDRMEDAEHKAKSLRVLGAKERSRVVLKEALLESPGHPNGWRTLGTWENEDVTQPALSNSGLSKSQIRDAFANTCEYWTYACTLSDQMGVDANESWTSLAILMQVYYSLLHDKQVVGGDQDDGLSREFQFWYSEQLTSACDRFIKLLDRLKDKEKSDDSQPKFVHLCTKCGTIRHFLTGRCARCGFLPLSQNDLFETWAFSMANIQVPTESEEDDYWVKYRLLERLSKDFKAELDSFRARADYKESLCAFSQNLGVKLERLQRHGLSDAELQHLKSFVPLRTRLWQRLVRLLPRRK